MPRVGLPAGKFRRRLPKPVERDGRHVARAKEPEHDKRQDHRQQDFAGRRLAFQLKSADRAAVIGDERLDVGPVRLRVDRRLAPASGSSNELPRSLNKCFVDVDDADEEIGSALRQAHVEIRRNGDAETIDGWPPTRRM